MRSRVVDAEGRVVEGAAVPVFASFSRLPSIGHSRVSSEADLTSSDDLLPCTTVNEDISRLTGQRRPLIRTSQDLKN